VALTLPTSLLLILAENRLCGSTEIRIAGPPGSLRANGIMGVFPFNYQPLNSSLRGLRLGAQEADCPVAKNVSD
jgi:hypothetical protein